MKITAAPELKEPKKVAVLSICLLAAQIRMFCDRLDEEI